MTKPDITIEVLVPEKSDDTAALALANGVAGRLGPGISVRRSAAADQHRAPVLRVNGREVAEPRTDDGLPPEWMVEAAVLRELGPGGLLFLCVANSARSQMGEGVARLLAPQTVRVQSAGSHPTALRPEAALVLAELGIDTARHAAKNVSEIDPATVDTVITLCGEEECPVFLGRALRLHWGLPDPAAVEGDEETRLAAFRRVRDELRKRISYIFE